MNRFRVERYHDISCGHRVFGHESKCAHLHGHNYRFHFICETEPQEVKFGEEVRGELDLIGRIIDFSAIKQRLCMWLESNWDHKFLVYNLDPIIGSLRELDPEGIVELRFNPTAENLARHMVNVVGPKELRGTGVWLAECKVEETAKCSASYARVY